MSKKPKVHASHIVHENPYWCVRHDELEWPSGEMGNYYVGEFRGTVTIVCVQDGKVLVIEQYRYPVDQEGSIEFPTGGIKEGQTSLEAAQAELAEETGYTAREWKQFGGYDALNGIMRNRYHLFTASGLTEGSQQLDMEEQGLRSYWLPIEEWRALIRDGKITDGCSLSAWAVYQECRIDGVGL